MVTKKEIDFSAYRQTFRLVRMGIPSRFLVRIFRFLKLNTVAYKLDFFERMLNFMKVIGLQILSNNFSSSQLHSGSFEWQDGGIEMRSLIEFLYHFEIIKQQNDQWFLNEAYKTILEENRIQKVLREIVTTQDGLTKKERKLIRDFLFIRDLIKKYNDPEYTFRQIRHNKQHWESLINEKQLDYEVRLCETLYNLKDLKINHKIRSPFDEDYYTESGQNAFRNFTRFAFLDYLKDLGKKDGMQVFDLGCGYGNYIETVHAAYPKAFVTGMELNPKVYSETSKKFTGMDVIEILNQDFFEYIPDKKFDLILMNYVLFYFNAEEKRRVMEKAQKMLSESGSIIVCQYFSGIEDLKAGIAQKQKDYALSKKIELYYSDKILYANSLWNDSVDTFSEAVQWDEFRTILSETGLHIESMVNADKFYYSFFIELKKN